MRTLLLATISLCIEGSYSSLWGMKENTVRLPGEGMVLLRQDSGSCVLLLKAIILREWRMYDSPNFKNGLAKASCQFSRKVGPLDSCYLSFHIFIN